MLSTTKRKEKPMVTTPWLAGILLQVDTVWESIAMLGISIIGKSIIL